MLLTNLANLLENVRALCASCHRNPSAIRLIPATKTVPIKTLNALPELGLFELGENRVQELMDKIATADARIKWHFIGQLQTNKVKYIIEHVAMIHSVDRLSLAMEIERQASKHNITMPILVEVNSAGIATHGGVKMDETLDFVRSLSIYPHLRVEGLMTVLPSEGIETAASGMEELFHRVQESCPGVRELSMGMSGDWMTAVRHGATIIRPGRLLFGERI